jgi:hypothetical protein
MSTANITLIERNYVIGNKERLFSNKIIIFRIQSQILGHKKKDATFNNRYAKS